MGLTFDQLEREALALPDAQRAELAKHLWQTLEPEQDPEAAEAWKVEVRKRLDELRSGKVKGIPGDEVISGIRARLRK